MAEVCKVQTAQSEAVLYGPGHTNVTVTGDEVMSTECCNDAGSVYTNIY